MRRMKWVATGMVWAVMAAALSMTSCALWRPAPSTIHASTWSVDMPDGWMCLRTPDYEMFSKDGPYLQYILIQERPLDYRFHYTRRQLNPLMLPDEAAGVIVASLSADPKIKNFSLLTNEPAMMDGILGFKLVYAYTDPQGVDTQSVYYGAIVGKQFFNLGYTAAKRHYFSKDLDEFEQIRLSLRFEHTS